MNVKEGMTFRREGEVENFYKSKILALLPDVLYTKLPGPWSDVVEF